MRFLLLLALAWTVSFAAPTTPKYTPLKFSEMAMSADLIVQGEIVVLTKDDFELQVETVLHGELKPAARKTRRVRVRRFANWTCAVRWHEYAPGQKFVLFLSNPRAQEQQFRIMSAGGEGEMFITDGPEPKTDSKNSDSRVVSLRGLGIESLATVKNHRLGLLAQSRQPGQLTQVRLTDLAHAIRELHRCLEIKPVRDEAGTRQYEIKRLTQGNELEQLAAKSKLAALLVQAAKAHLNK